MKITQPNLFEKSHTSCRYRYGNECLEWKKTNNVIVVTSFLDYCCGFMTSKEYSDCGQIKGCSSNSCWISDCDDAIINCRRKINHGHKKH